MVGFCSLVAACLVGKILTAELLCHIYTCFYSRTFQYFLFSFFCLLCFVTNTCRLLCYMNFMENVAVRAVLLRARQTGFSAPFSHPQRHKASRVEYSHFPSSSIYLSTALQTAPCCAAVSLCSYPSAFGLCAPSASFCPPPPPSLDLPSRPLLVQNAVPTLLAADGLALVDADLDATLGAEVVHGGNRGCLAIRAAAGSGSCVLFAR